MTTYIGPLYTSHGSGQTVSDASWRAWSAQIHAALSGAGLVQTSDTGQIDTATATAPVANGTDGGYSMWRFNDSVQGTDPAYLKIIFRRGGSSGALVLKIQVGQGSNGSGTLTGFTSNQLNCFGNSSNVAGAVDMQVYACHIDGNFWLSDGVTSVVSYVYAPRNYFNLARSRNPSTGALDGRGMFIAAPCYGRTSTNGGNIQYQYVRWLSGNQKLYPVTKDCLYTVSGYTPDTNSAGDRLAWPMYYYDAGMVLCWATFGLDRSVMPTSPTSFTAAPYGTSRTWISWHTAPFAHAYADDGISETLSLGALAMLWE